MQTLQNTQEKIGDRLKAIYYRNHMEQELEQLREENKELRDKIEDLQGDIADMAQALDEIYGIAKRF